MDAAGLILAMTLALGGPIPAGDAVVAAERTWLFGNLLCITLEKSEVRRFSALTPRQRRKGRAVVGCAEGTFGDVQWFLTDKRGVRCQGGGFLGLDGTIFLDGCGL